MRNKEVNMKHIVKMVGIFGMTAFLAIPGFAQVGSRMQGRNMRAPRMQNGMMVMLKARQAELKLTDKQLASNSGSGGCPQEGRCRHEAGGSPSAYRNSEADSRQG